MCWIQRHRGSCFIPEISAFVFKHALPLVPVGHEAVFRTLSLCFYFYLFCFPLAASSTSKSKREEKDDEEEKEEIEIEQKEEELEIGSEEETEVGAEMEPSSEGVQTDERSIIFK